MKMPIAYTFTILALIILIPMKALAQTPELDNAKSDVADAKLNLELANMDVISGCDMSRTLLGDHPSDPAAENLLLKCDQSIMSVKHECDAHPEYALTTCSEPRIAEYITARGLSS
jgi:hypothetical protein